MRFTLGVVLLCVLALAACSDDDGDDEPSRTTADAPALDLRVVVDPNDGSGEPRVRTIRCEALGSGPKPCPRLANIQPRDLGPVPRDVACAEIYGGPATAMVTGTIRGHPVASQFDLTDACQIDRWRRNAALLGPPPRG